MRVTQYSVINPYKQNLEDIQQRRYENQLRMSTGKEILSLGDAPEKIAPIKKLTSLIKQNGEYLDNLEEQISQFQQTENYLNAIADKMEKIRQIAIDGTQVGNMGNLSVLGNYIKGIITDIIRDGNADYNGSFLFAGTKTKAESFDESLPNGNDMPFELVEAEPTDTNPSGLSVVFKGNQENKILNKDQKATEIVNTKSQEIFGVNGTGAFEQMIALYNLVTYNPDDGTTRGVNNVLAVDEVNKMNEIQKKIADYSYAINQTTSRNGARSNRFQILRDQISEENLRLEGYLSQKSDADVAKTALNLSKDEYALQYALQVGGNLLQNSLFDFIR